MLNHNVVLGSAFHCCFHFAVQSGVIDRLFFLSAQAAGDRCWVLLSVALCVGSRDQVQHSSNTLMDIGTPGRQRRRTLSASTLQQKSWEGEWEPAVIYLQWDDLDIKLCISFLLLSCNGSLNNTPLPDFKQRFRRLWLSLQTGLIGTSASSFYSHPAWKNKKRWCLCTRDAKRAHAVVKMEAKRKCRGGGGRKLTIFGISR